MTQAKVEVAMNQAREFCLFTLEQLTAERIIFGDRPEDHLLNSRAKKIDRRADRLIRALEEMRRP